MMPSTCSILIPTHNRPRYLERCVRWFSDFGCPIVIADSSRESWSSPLRDAPRVHYLHRPGGFEVYLAKLEAALGSVETPLVAMCADDDFITREGFVRSVEFLDGNPDYAFCQGFAYLYQVFGNRVVVWPMVYEGHDVCHEDWIDRVERPLSTVFYGVNRTTNLRSALAFLARQDFAEILDHAAGMFDAAITLHSARCGKFRRLAVPFALREYSPQVSSVGGRPLTITSRNVPDFYRNLRAELMAGERDDARRRRLTTVLARDYAGLISFDLSIAPSRKARLRWLPDRALPAVEHAWRLLMAARMYGSRRFAGFSSVFRDPEYRRFKHTVLRQEGA